MTEKDQQNQDEELLSLARAKNETVEIWRRRTNGQKARAASQLLVVALREAYEQGMTEETAWEFTGIVKRQIEHELLEAADDFKKDKPW